MEQEELCDFCGLPADPSAEECWRVDCRAHCSSSGAGDVYHAECMVTFLKGLSLPGVRHLDAKIAKRIPRWPCPKGKGKGPGQLCKAWVEGGATSVVQRKAKAPKPPPAPAPAAGPRSKPAAAPSSKAALAQGNPPRQPAAKPPNHVNHHHQQQPAVMRRPVMEQAPKPDPLGRKLVGGSKAGEQQQPERVLPPGYDPDAAVPNNKNSRRRAKAAAAAAAAAAGAAQDAAGGGVPGPLLVSGAGLQTGALQQEQEIGRSSSASDGGQSGGVSTSNGPVGFGSGAGFLPTIDEQHRALMGGGNFITRPEDLAKLLGGLGLMSDEEEEDEEHHQAQEQAHAPSKQPLGVGQQHSSGSGSVSLTQVAAVAADSTHGGPVAAEAAHTQPLTSAVVSMPGLPGYLLGTQQQQQQAQTGHGAVQLPMAPCVTAAAVNGVSQGAGGTGWPPYLQNSTTSCVPQQSVDYRGAQPAAAHVALPFLQLQPPAHGAAVLHHTLKGAAAGAAAACGVSVPQGQGVCGAGAGGAAAPAGGADEDEEDAALLEELMLMLT